MIRKSAASVLLVSLLCTLLALLLSCAEGRSARALMEEFCSAYGIAHTVYSPEVREGEAGYVKDGFFAQLYGEGEEWVSDFAIVLLSDTAHLSECGVFICYTDYDAIQVTDMLHRRIKLIREVGAASGLAIPEGAFVYREGRCVVVCALPDEAIARRLWREIL